MNTSVWRAHFNSPRYVHVKENFVIPIRTPIEYFPAPNLGYGILTETTI